MKSTKHFVRVFYLKQNIDKVVIYVKINQKANEKDGK